jgi:tRNA A-37 threonylcarbamoyl transferase component Bud32/tetratricopeptide (TPR) repeat protein
VPLPEPLARITTALADRYTLERELGRGGMATVYLAQDLKHGRRVALKVLHPELAYALGPDRFLREIDVAAKLSHPHILPLFDSGEAAGLLYYVMPYVEGESLRDRLNQETQLPLDEALRIAREVADALGYAHRQGVVHRDIKPENILLSGGHALVADFGIARALVAGDARTVERLTETGMVIGTPAYMSPEQAGGERDVDGRSDVYSLGCVLYEMLVGAPPFAGASAQAILARHALDPVPPVRTRRATVTPGVERAVLKALAKAPTDRFATAMQFSEALATPGTVEVEGPRRRVWYWGLLATGAAVVLGLAAASALFWRRRIPAKPLDAKLVVVAPFRVTSADPALGYLREGMVDLIAAKLTGEGGPRAADPRAVLSAWRGASASNGGDLSQDGALKLAARLGAGQLLLGNVVGAPGHITLNAALLTVPGGRTGAETSVEGPADSLSGLVDRLAARLLTLGAGEGEQRLSALTSTSLPALRAYLEGQSVFRRGQYAAAMTSFEQALQLDSTFALAAVGLLAGGARTGDYEPTKRAERLAWAARGRLDPRDHAYLMVLMGLTYTDTIPHSQLLHRAEQFVAVAPDRAEAYLALCDVLFNFGELLGLPAAHERAAAACRRAIELDSTYAPPLDDLAIIAARLGDTASVRRVDHIYREIDPARGPPDWIRWRMALALDDRVALDSLRARFASLDVQDLTFIGQLGQYDGVGLDDAERAQRAWLQRESRSKNREAALAEMSALALNRGRPAAARRDREEEREARPGSSASLMEQVMDALYWDGDTVAGGAAAKELEHIAAAQPHDLINHRWPSCVVEQWHLAHGQLGTVRRTIAELRSPTAPHTNSEVVMLGQGCALLLEAVLAAAEKRPDAATHLARLDSLMRTSPPYLLFTRHWNLMVAQLMEAQGDRHGALAATRRRLYFWAEPFFLSTYLREEGRLAALTGDRPGAIRAYQHYLALRADPEPALRPQVEQVRAELAQLLKEPAR